MFIPPKHILRVSNLALDDGKLPGTSETAHQAVTDDWFRGPERPMPPDVEIPDLEDDSLRQQYVNLHVANGIPKHLVHIVVEAMRQGCSSRARDELARSDTGHSRPLR